MEKKLHQWINRPSLCRASVCACMCTCVFKYVGGYLCTELPTGLQASQRNKSKYETMNNNKMC